MIHAPHPKCPECKKSLFKAFDGPWNGNATPKVTKDMPYRFCRNVKACSLAMAAQTGVGHALETLQKNVKKLVKATKPKISRLEKERLPGETPKAYLDRLNALENSKATIAPPIPTTRKAVDGKITALKRKSVPKGPAKVIDNDVVSVARTRVAALIKAFGNEIGLVLALANQELGNNAVANALIDEYKLFERFGLEKF